MKILHIIIGLHKSDAEQNLYFLQISKFYENITYNNRPT